MLKNINAIFIFLICIQICAYGMDVMNLKAAELSMSSALGMNAHLGFSCSRKFADELCHSMKDAGVQIVRIDVYWNDKDWLEQQQILDREVYYADKHGLKILLSIPQVPEKRDSAYVQKWLEMLAYYATRYNGKTQIQIDGEAEPRYVKIDYFEPMNEPDLKMDKLQLNVPFVFYLIQKASETIKGVRSDAVVVMPGLTKNNRYTTDLLRFKSANGKTLVDYVDVTNVHFYIDKQRKYIAFLDEWLELLKNTGLGDKPHWVTECGASLWEFSQIEQAKLLPKQNIVVLSKKFEKVFYYQYHAFGGNRSPQVHNQRQNYYAVIGPGISNSYGSFYVNDDKYETAISSGDGSKKVYLRKQNKDNFMLYSHSKTTLFRLKTKGVAIGGRGYTMRSVSLLHENGSETELWKGSLKVIDDGEQYLKLPATKFWRMNEKDKICVKVDSVVDLNERWTGLDPWLSYNAYRVQSSFFTAHSSVPEPFDFGISKLNAYLWKTPEKGNVWALWADDGKKVKVNVVNNSEKIGFVDYLGKTLLLTNGIIEITDALVYVFGADSLKLKSY